MAYVRRCFPQFADATGLLQIRDAFFALASGEIESDLVSTLLLRYCGGTQPLDQVLAVLQAPEQPLTQNAKEDPIDPAGSLRRKPRPWSQPEDVRLLAGIHRFGADNWGAVAQFVGNGRTRAQCSQRWIRGLDPRICKDKWSDSDEHRLLELVKEDGSKGWTKVATSLGNRSDVQCRYHFFQMKREGRLPPDFSDLLPAEESTAKPRGTFAAGQASPALFEEQRQRFLLSGARSNSFQSEKLSYPPFLHFTGIDSPPVRIQKEGFPRCKSGESPVPLTVLSPVNSPSNAAAEREAAEERDGITPGLPGLDIPGLHEGIDWSIPSEDDGDSRGIFGTTFLW
jgi:hypothetical protein